MGSWSCLNMKYSTLQIAPNRFHIYMKLLGEIMYQCLKTLSMMRDMILLTVLYLCTVNALYTNTTLYSADNTAVESTQEPDSDSHNHNLRFLAILSLLAVIIGGVVWYVRRSYKRMLAQRYDNIELHNMNNNFKDL